MEKMNLGEKSKSQIDNNTCFILVDCICCQERKLKRIYWGQALQKGTELKQGEMEFRFLFPSSEKSKVAAAQTVLDLDQMTLFFLDRMPLNLTSTLRLKFKG